MIQRTSSKAKANMNRVVWTGTETVYVPFHCGGVVKDGLRLGSYRVVGKECYCSGFTVRLDQPARHSRICSLIGLYSADDLQAGASVVLNGGSPGGSSMFPMPVFMALNSLWHFRVEMQVPQGLTVYAPTGITVTYQILPAFHNLNVLPAYRDQEKGVGFDKVGTSMQVYPDVRHG